MGMQQLLSETKLTGEQRHYLENIGSASEILLSLMSDILEYSKLEEQPALAVDHLPFDIVDSLEETVSMVAVAARNKAIELALYVPAGLPRRVLGDSLRLRRLVMNYLSNALKFTPQGGRVELRVELEPAPAPSSPPRPAPLNAAPLNAGPLNAPPLNAAPLNAGPGAGPGPAASSPALCGAGPSSLGSLASPRTPASAPSAPPLLACLSAPAAPRRPPPPPPSPRPPPTPTRRCGTVFRIGISKAHQALLFQPYSQVPKNRSTRMFEGTGLGLAISRRLAEAMGGATGVLSEEGKGSTFWCTVTLRRDRTWGPGPSPLAAPARAASVSSTTPLPTVTDVDSDAEAGAEAGPDAPAPPALRLAHLGALRPPHAAPPRPALRPPHHRPRSVATLQRLDRSGSGEGAGGAHLGLASSLSLPPGSFGQKLQLEWPDLTGVHCILLLREAGAARALEYYLVQWGATVEQCGDARGLFAAAHPASLRDLGQLREAVPGTPPRPAGSPGSPLFGPFSPARGGPTPPSSPPSLRLPTGTAGRGSLGSLAQFGGPGAEAAGLLAGKPLVVAELAVLAEVDAWLLSAGAAPADLAAHFRVLALLPVDTALPASLSCFRMLETLSLPVRPTLLARAIYNTIRLSLGEGRLPRTYAACETPALGPASPAPPEPGPLDGGPAPPTPHPGAGSGEAPSATARRGLILLVDDIKANLLVAKKMLELSGHAVETAENGQQCIDLYAADPDKWDCIVLDVEMPVCDGREACQRIRAMEREEAGRAAEGEAGAAARRVPIVFMTANALQEDRQEALTLGADEFLTKPIRRPVLIEVVNRFLSQRHSSVPACPSTL
eukprot:tig00021721_g23215.t1